MRFNPAIAFWIAFLATLFCPALFSKFHLLYFAPYLILSYYKFSRFAVLWRAIGCGILIDLFSSTPCFGLSSINYCLVSFFLYGQTRNFFEDKLSTLPLMTALFSFLSTLISVILALCFDQKIVLSWKWSVTDLIGMSLFDALFALIFFSLPHQGMRILKLLLKPRNKRTN
ncbi:MAG: hypothetical protein WAM28_07765 [Chlamydiales bacterium]